MAWRHGHRLSTGSWGGEGVEFEPRCLRRTWRLSCFWPTAAPGGGAAVCVFVRAARGPLGWWGRFRCSRLPVSPVHRNRRRPPATKATGLHAPSQKRKTRGESLPARCSCCRAGAWPPGPACSAVRRCHSGSRCCRAGAWPLPVRCRCRRSGACLPSVRWRCRGRHRCRCSHRGCRPSPMAAVVVAAVVVSPLPRCFCVLPGPA